MAAGNAATARPAGTVGGRGLRPPCGVRAPLRPPRARAPAAEQRNSPGRPLAVTAKLGDGTVPDRLRDRGRLLPGSTLPAGQGHRGGRTGAGAAGEPGSDGPPRPGDASRRPDGCRPARARRPAPSRARRCRGRGPQPPGEVPMGRGMGASGPGDGDRSPGPGGRPRDHPRHAAPRGLGRTGIDRAARRSGVPVPASRPRGGPGAVVAEVGR